MNKKLFRASLLALLLGTPALFSACSDDDEGGGSAPTAESAGIEHPVSTISYYGTNYSLSYANGKLTRFISSDSEYDIKITPNPLSISGTNDEDDYSYRSLRTNAQGYLVSGQIVDSYYDEDDDETYVDRVSFSCAYNSDGRLTSFSYDGRGDDDWWRGKYLLTYDGGNLATITEEYEEDGWEETKTHTFSYNNDLSANKNSGIYLHSELMDPDIFLWYGGLLGKPSENLPTAIATSEYGSTSRTSYSYTRDSEGRVTAVYENRNRLFSFGYSAAALTAPLLETGKPASAVQKTRRHLRRTH